MVCCSLKQTAHWPTLTQATFRLFLMEARCTALPTCGQETLPCAKSSPRSVSVDSPSPRSGCLRPFLRPITTAETFLSHLTESIATELSQKSFSRRFHLCTRQLHTRGNNQWVWYGSTTTWCQTHGRRWAEREAGMCSGPSQDPTTSNVVVIYSLTPHSSHNHQKNSFKF